MTERHGPPGQTDTDADRRGSGTADTRAVVGGPDRRVAQLGLPTGIYRAWAWVLAATTAAMNFWHGATSASGPQRGAVLAPASLLGVGLWELTVRLRALGRRRGSAGTGLPRGRTVRACTEEEGPVRAVRRAYVFRTVRPLRYRRTQGPENAGGPVRPSRAGPPADQVPGNVGGVASAISPAVGCVMGQDLDS